jgi:hypothetical protein
MYAVIAVFNSLSVRGLSVYEMHCDEVQVFRGNFSANFSCTTSAYLLHSRRSIQQEKRVIQLKEP